MTPAVATFPSWCERLQFDEPAHRYTLDGRELAHVTRILKAVGVSLDFERLVVERKITAEDLAYKRDLGRAAHMATHYYDEGTLERETVGIAVEPRLQAWVDWRARTGFTPVMLETPLHHPTLLVAGMNDRAGYFAKFEGHSPNDLITVDLKLGDPEDAGAQWQTAAYAEFLAVALEQHPGFDAFTFRLQPRYAVQLGADGRAHHTKYPNHASDWRDFQHFVTTYRRQHAQRTGRAA